MKTLSYPKYTYCLLFCLQAVSQSAELPKLFNNTALNLGGAWDAAGAVPGTGDVMLWNSTFVDTVSAATSLSQLGGDLSVQGIKVTNVGGAVNQATRYIGFQNTSSANTLTLGSGGIDMSTATQALMAQSKITLGADQTWNIANANTAGNPAGFNNGEDLSFNAQAGSAPFNLGSKTLNVSGAGQVTITSGYTLGSGTLNVANNLFVIQGGTSRVTTLASTLNVNVNAGTLRLQSNSGALSSAAPIVVGAGTLELFVNNATQTVVQTGSTTLNTGSTLTFNQVSAANNTIAGLNVAGNTTIRVVAGGATNAANISTVTGNLTGSGNIAYQNIATGAAGGLPNGMLRLSGDNSGYTGTITLNGASGNRILRLNAANSGSAAATWNVGTDNVLQVNGVGVQLGTLTGAGTVTNSSTTTPATLTLSAGTFSGAVTNGTAQPTAVTKTGPGTLVLSGLNSYTGATTINSGTLVLSPEHTGAGTVTVADGAVFGTQVKNAGTNLFMGNLTVGSSTGATALFDYAGNSNPTVAALVVNDLLLAGTSTVRVSGKNLTTGTFPLFQFTTLNGASSPISSLVLKLPTRTNGSLSQLTPGTVSLTISDTQQVKWDGDVSNNWDVDPDGSGSTGTPNWRTTVTNADTRYIQGANGTDVVTFDDTATGTGTVNLTTTLSPLGLTVNNTTAKNYTFTGSGKLTGLTSLDKSGNGTLTIANTTPNDYSGGTVIAAGTLSLGDGVTAGAGQIAGAIDNSGTLLLNRPDDFDFTNTLTGLGTVEKAQANTVSFLSAITLDSPLAVTGGKVRFTAGGTLNGVISGAGQLEAAGGTVLLGGLDPNTRTGLTTVSAGTLQLSKPIGVNAVGGDVTITGTGVLNTLADEQIPDTATISALGSSADSWPGAPGKETFANALVNGTSAATQLILRNNANVTNLATVNQGILGVASNNTANVNAIAMTSPTAIVRVAGGSNPSFMNVGPGGITASGGDVQVKFSTAEFDATLNLSGNVTTTGNLIFSNGGYGGAALNVVRLNGERTFNIGAGTLTTIAPDIANYINSEAAEVPGSLIKTGDGALVLDASSAATYTGGTTVNAGAMRVHGSLAGTLLVNANGSIGGGGTLSGAATINGTLNPGGVGAATAGHLHSTSSVTFTPDSDFIVDVGNWAGTTEGTDWDHLTVDSLVLSATPSNKLVIHVSGTPTAFTETNKTIVIATSTQPVTGFNASAIQIDSTGFSGTGTWAVQLTGNKVELVYTAGTASAYSSWATAEGLTPANNDPAADPDNDGQNNLMEFALNGTALSGTSSGKMATKIGTVGGQQALTLTLPVRSSASFTGTTELVGTADGVRYRIQASDALAAWTLQVTEVTGADATAIQAGLPSPLPAGWSYRTFRSPGAISGDSADFLRAVIEPNP